MPPVDGALETRMTLPLTAAPVGEPVVMPRDAAWCLAGARRALFDWAEAVASRDVPRVLALYAEDAILVPTLSDEIRDCEAERRRYFEGFLARGPIRCEIEHFKKRVSAKLGTVVVGGLYRFHFQRPEGIELVDARFLFTFEEIEGRWLITGHHSSKLSEAI